MHKIKCPKCGTVFTINEDAYADILNQVRSDAFKAELNEQIHRLTKQHADQTKILDEKYRNQTKILDEKYRAQTKLLDEKYRDQLHSHEAEYQTKLASAESNYQKDLENLQFQSETQAQLLRQELQQELNSQLAAKDQEITRLKSALSASATEQKLAVSAATSQLERENDSLKKDLENAKSQSESKELLLKQSYEQQIKDRDDTIDRLKDLKSKLSTKMVGETLEQHCQNEFNAIRATAFPRAQFGKDNAVSAQSGSKGDFIFRDFDDNGTEIVSIMFEMKNENDTTATKHKNEHFFKELDKDRREKNCEYAVLVSLLEADSDLYNQGIVDVSYAYPKMFVIRPQFFLPLIGIITNTAKNALAYKSELELVKNQNLDITDFEDRLNQFKTSFALNSDRATKNFNKAIDDIDKSIKNLQDTKKALQLTVQNFATANNKLDDLTIKRLTRGNATMTKLFDDLKNDPNPTA